MYKLRRTCFNSASEYWNGTSKLEKPPRLEHAKASQPMAKVPWHRAGLSGKKRGDCSRLLINIQWIIHTHGSCHGSFPCPARLWM